MVIESDEPLGPNPVSDPLETPTLLPWQKAGFSAPLTNPEMHSAEQTGVIPTIEPFRVLATNERPLDAQHKRDAAIAQSRAEKTAGGGYTYRAAFGGKVEIAPPIQHKITTTESMGKGVPLRCSKCNRQAGLMIYDGRKPQCAFGCPRGTVKGS